MSQYDSRTSAERELIDSIVKRFISLGSSLHGQGLLVGICRESAEQIARDGHIDDRDVDDLVFALRERGFGKRDFVVTLRGEAAVIVQAANEEDACDQIEQMDWEDFEIQHFEIDNVDEA